MQRRFKGLEMGQEKILIVEDEVRVAQTLESALTLSEENRYQVQVCHSGEEALLLLPKTKFDLLVTDLRMPGISGLELVEQVRKISPDTRCILITAYGTPQTEERAAQLDVDAFLKKPFNMQSFVETVRQTLGGRTNPRQFTAFSEQGMRAIHDRIEQLREDVSGLGVLLLDPSGQLINECGKRGNFDANTFLALLANAMAAVNELARVMQDPESFNLHFHEGKNYETYTARVNDQVFLCLVLEKYGSSSRIGMVWLYLRRAITDLRELFVQGSMTEFQPGLDRDVVNALQNALDGALGGLGMLGEDSALTPTPTPPFAEPHSIPVPKTAPEPVKETPKPAAPVRRTISELFEPSAGRKSTSAPEPPVLPAQPAPEPPAVEVKTTVLPDGVDEKTVLSFEEAVRLGLIKLDGANEEDGKKKK
jgi:CheY-like chemotaxis protein